MRGLLALAVAAYHLSVWWELWPSGTPWNMAFAKLGNFGVSAFFLLSGFLLARQSPWTSIQREGLGRYYLRRWLRLAPLFYLAVALNFAFQLGMGPQPSLRMLAENFTLAFGAIHPNHALVTGGWYVGLAALAYAAWPGVAWLRARLGWAVAAVLAAGLGWASLAWTLEAVPAAEPWSRFHAYVQPGNQVFLLALGALLAELHVRLPWRPRPAAVLALGLPLLVLLLHQSRPFYDHFDVLTGWARYRSLALVAGLVLAAALAGGRPGPAGRALARFGAWSYGIYLLHPFAHRLVATVGLPPGSRWIPFLLAFAASVGFGALAHRWIEVPVSRLGARRRRG